MKRVFTIVAISYSLLLISCNNSNSKPSIKDNSVRNIEVEKVDYSGVDSEVLLKHIMAHFDLAQYQLGKEKLTSLISSRPDLIDSLELNELKSNFDNKLAQIEAKEANLAEAARKARMPNAAKKMRTYKEGKITYYIDKTSPEFDSKECFYAYFVKDNIGEVKLKFKIRYVDTKWLDIENFMITVNQLDHSLTGSITKSETKGKKKYKHELLDMVIDSPENFKTLNAIANGDKATALYVGKLDYRKREISKEQCTAIRNVIDAYLFMGGENYLKSTKVEYTNTEE